MSILSVFTRFKVQIPDARIDELSQSTQCMQLNYSNLLRCSVQFCEHFCVLYIIRKLFDMIIAKIHFHEIGLLINELTYIHFSFYMVVYIWLFIVGMLRVFQD